MLVTISESLIDQYGHVNYKHYPALFEPAQDEFMDELGTGFAAIEERFGLRSVVRAMEVAYTGELLAGNIVDIITSVGVGRTSLTYLQTAHGSKGIAATLKLVVVLVDKDGKPQPVPDEIRKKLLGEAKSFETNAPRADA